MPATVVLRPRPSPARSLAVLVALSLATGLLAGGAAHAQAVPGGRWDASLAAFAKSDASSRPAAGGVLFVGSSSIRLWSHLADDFHQVRVINRGFGGSTMADCASLARQLVVQYQPRHVLVYAGDNDLAEGRSPQQVLDSFRLFVAIVRAELPDVRISYISVKPSPNRVALLPQVRETNRLLADYVAGLSNASYIDVYTPMLDAQGQPRADLYGPDRLHMNAAGYALWRQLVATHLVATPPPNDLNARTP